MSIGKKPPLRRKTSNTKPPDGQRSTTPLHSSSPRVTRRPLSTGPLSGGTRPTTTGGSPGMKRRSNTTNPKPPVSVTRKTSVKSSGRTSAPESKSSYITTRKTPDPHRPHQTTEHGLHKQARKYDKSSAEIKETVVVTSTTTHLSVPKPGRSSQGGGGRKSSHRSEDEKRDAEKDGDNLSETGTYTIESDAVSKEIEDARRSIDQAFGIEDGPEGRHRRLLDDNGNIEELANTDEDDIGEELPHDSDAGANSSSQVCLFALRTLHITKVMILSKVFQSKANRPLANK